MLSCRAALTGVLYFGALVDEIFFQAQQGVQQGVRFRRREPLQCLCARFQRNMLHLRKGWMRLFGYIETPGATVHRIPVMLDPTSVLQTIYVAAKRDVLNFKNVR